MCGIAGYIILSSHTQKFHLENANHLIHHRGPEHSGYYYSNKAGLTHARLCIIDLSPNAHQPMCINNHHIVYNGEVYNFQEIKKQLHTQIPSIKFFTQSDTEVILQSHIYLKEKSLSLFNGMFAYAIYDDVNHTLFLARDRMGVKPLFYYYDSHIFAFASEIKALLSFPFIHKKLNWRAIPYYFHLGYIPEPFTAFENIYKFPAGHYAIVSSNGLQLHPYWTIESQIQTHTYTQEQNVLDSIEELLYSSIQYRMISDVPYGVFLSGGVDSSIVTAIAQQINPHIQTFNIAFKEKKYDESLYAQKVAQHLHTNHHEYLLSYDDVISLIPEIMSTYDEPYADSSALPTMLLSKMCRTQIKMALSGDGGDELFWGYGTYKWAKRLHSFPFQYLKKPLAYLFQFGNSRTKRVSLLLQSPLYHHNLFSHIFSQEQYLFSERELSQYLSLRPDALIFDFQPTARMLNPVEFQALFDLKYYLKDDLLVKVDRASMKYALEVREPLLDYRLVSYVLNIHPSLKMKNHTPKYLLKKILYQYLPKELVDRPKWGFAVPIRYWLKNELSYLIHEYLSEDKIKAHGIFKASYIQELIHKYKNGEDYLYNRIWALIIFQQFLKTHFE